MVNWFSSHVQKFRANCLIANCLLLTFTIFAVHAANAQVNRSELSGTVTDSSGRLLPEAHIMVVQSSTALRRETVSDARGNYSISELPVGIYTVTFVHQGFEKLEFVDVEQVIGRTRTLDASLRIAGGQERVEVSRASALMDHNTSAVTGLIPQR